MPKNGKKFFGLCSKMLSPSVPPRYSNSSSTSESASGLMIDRSLQSAAEIITKWSTDNLAYAEVASMFHHSKGEALGFIRCVNELQKVMYLLTSEKLEFSQNLMKIAMKRLQVEFYRILSVRREPLDVESSSDRFRMAEDCDVRRVSSVAMADLRAIADCMISSGYTKECVEIYKTIRKSVVDEGIHRLGIAKFSSQIIRKMNFEVVDFIIKKWFEGLNTAITTIFNVERDLCDYVFATSESVRETCFTKTCKDGAMFLFAFPEVFVKSQKSQKNFFYLLDMFTALRENWSRIESIFSFESTEVIRSQVIASLSLLSESISGMLSNYESSIQNDSSNSLSVDGGIHILALQSMDCLSLLAEYREALYMIFSRWPPKKSSLPVDSCSSFSASDDSPVSSVSSYMARIIFILLCKLDSKARQCDDISLSYLFLANNVRFVVWQVQSSKLHHLLGEEWIELHKAKVKQYIDSYERLAWGKVISTLPRNPTATLSTAEVAEIYNNFNSCFKEAYRKQRSSILADPKLRFEILSIAKSWLPVYREFYYAHKIPVGEEVIARLAPEDVENYLSNLFFPQAELNSFPNKKNPFSCCP